MQTLRHFFQTYFSSRSTIKSPSSFVPHRETSHLLACCYLLWFSCLSRPSSPDAMMLVGSNGSLRSSVVPCCWMMWCDLVQDRHHLSSLSQSGVMKAVVWLELGHSSRTPTIVLVSFCLDRWRSWKPESSQQHSARSQQLTFQRHFPVTWTTVVCVWVVFFIHSWSPSLANSLMASNTYNVYYKGMDMLKFSNGDSTNFKVTLFKGNDQFFRWRHESGTWH